MRAVQIGALELLTVWVSPFVADTGRAVIAKSALNAEPAVAIYAGS